MNAAVKTAQLKSHLSEYLKSVRKGNEVVVKDRDMPIAKLVPYEEPPAPKLLVRAPKRTLQEVDALPYLRPANLEPADVDAALEWTRGERF